MLKLKCSRVIGFFILATLAFFPQQISSQEFQSENLNMELVGHKLIGSGKEKVLVLHNWVGDSTSYDLLLPFLDTEKFAYLFIDLRGYGRSKEMRGKYTVEEASADALKLINSLSWDKFHVIGHSMSGMIAQKIALDNFSRVKSVVAITPVPACGSPGPKELMDFLESAALNNDDNAIQCVNMLTSHRYSNLFAKNMIHYWRACSTSDARIGYLHMFANTDFSSAAKGLKTPMLVIFGEHDMEGSEVLMRNTFLQWYPNAQLECCKCSGHYPILETPVYLASIIEKFLLAHCE